MCCLFQDAAPIHPNQFVFEEGCIGDVLALAASIEFEHNMRKGKRKSRRNKSCGKGVKREAPNSKPGGFSVHSSRLLSPLSFLFFFPLSAFFLSFFLLFDKYIFFLLRKDVVSLAKKE